MDWCENHCIIECFSGCYQPAGPLIPMSPGWDPQKVSQPALQQLALASPGSVVQPVTCQTTITSASTTNTSRPAIKLCEDGTHVPVSSRPTAESVVAKPQKMVSPGSVEVGVGTHSADKRSNRNRSFHSSIRSSDKLRNPAGNVPVGAAHLVVADQERELDLSQKGSNGYMSGTTVVTTHESIIKPAIGVVQDVSHATVSTFASGVSQIGHLERFVRGLVTSGTGLPVLQAPQIVSHASKSPTPQPASSPLDSSNALPKRKMEREEVTADEKETVSPKITKYSVTDEECTSEVQRPSEDEVQAVCTVTEDPEVAMDNPHSSSDDVSADVAVKQDAEMDESTGTALLLPDVVSTSVQSSEGELIQCAVVEDVNCPAEYVESTESCELVTNDTSSDAAASCLPAISEKIHLPSPPKETPDTERVGNLKSKDNASSNPRKALLCVELAEPKQRTSPVRSRNVAELNRKRMSVSAQEKRSEKLGTSPAEKVGGRSDEGSARSASARRKRDTGGWEWYGDPETKPVYFKVI